jgi:hypothetical protein
MRAVVLCGVGAAVLLVGLVLAGAVVSCVPRARPLGWEHDGPDGTDTPARFRDEGERLVELVCEFRRGNGHWPVSLAQLPPDSVPPGWAYRFEPDRAGRRFWEVGRGDGSPRNSIRFVFDLGKRHGSWNTSWGGFAEFGPSGVAIPDAQTGARQPPAAVVAKLLSDRGADPRHALLSTKVLLQVRLDAGEVAGAIAECEAALAAHPDDVWLTSFLTAARVREGAGARPDPLPVEARARATGRFGDYVHAACVCHELGLVVRAAAMLDAALAPERANQLKVDTTVPQQDCWCAAVLAVRMRDYDLLDRILDAWVVNYEAARYGDESFRAFRAFTCLKTGRLDQARAEMHELEERLSHRGVWARKNTEALRVAIERGDTAFGFDPGPFPALDTSTLFIR